MEEEDETASDDEEEEEEEEGMMIPPLTLLLTQQTTAAVTFTLTSTSSTQCQEYSSWVRVGLKGKGGSRVYAAQKHRLREATKISRGRFGISVKAGICVKLGSSMPICSGTFLGTERER